jgi:hypothetical protein
MAETLFDTVNIIAFNRPDYFERMAASFAAQLVNLESCKIHVWIDGYGGSLDEERHRPDRTNEVLKIAMTHFPQASVHRFSDNLGIALIYNEAESYALQHSAGPYVLFFEDDLVLGPGYLEAMDLLMVWALSDKNIAIVAAHGYVHEYLGEVKERFTLPVGVYHLQSLWAYAVKLEHMRERKAFLDGYISIVGRDKYHRRNPNEVQQYCMDQGTDLIVNASQDFAKHAALLLSEKCAVTVSKRLAKYIGVVGTNADAATFRALGYEGGDIERFEPVEYKALLDSGYSLNELRALRLIELLNIKVARLSNALIRERHISEN